MQNWLTNATKSKRSTTLGIISGLMIILPEIAKLFDEPIGGPNWSQVMLGVMIALGLSQVKDGHRTSEEMKD